MSDDMHNKHNVTADEDLSETPDNGSNESNSSQYTRANFIPFTPTPTG